MEWPARRTRAADYPWDLHRAPISTDGYSSFLPSHLNLNSHQPLYSANHERISGFDSTLDPWRRGTYRQQGGDQEALALSRYNALISARMYLEGNSSKFEHWHPYDQQVRSLSCSYRTSGERDLGDSLRYVHGEGYNSRKRAREIEEGRNSSPPPSRSVSNSSPKRLNHGGVRETAGIDVKHGGDDDELEEGQLTPSSGNCHKQEEGSHSFSSCKPEMVGEIENENEKECAEEELMFPVRFRENSCAIDVTTVAKRKMKKQKSTSQIKKAKTKQKRSGRESNVIVVCGRPTDSRTPNASGLHQNCLFNQGGSSLSEFSHRDIDSRTEQSVPNDGLLVALNQECNSGSQCSTKCNAKAAGRTTEINIVGIETSDCLKNFNSDSVHGFLGCHALQGCKPLEQSPQKAIENRHEDIVHLKDVQCSQSGLASETPGQSLQGDHPALVSEFAEQSKLQQNLHVRSTADLSVLVQPIVCIGPQAVHTVDNYCQGSANCKGDNPGCSMTRQEVEELRYTESFKNRGSVLRMGMADNQIAEFSTFLQENISMPHKESVLQASEVHRGWHSEVLNSQSTLPLCNHSPFDNNKNVKPVGLANSSIPSPVLNLEPKIAVAGAYNTNKDKGVSIQPIMHSSNLQVEDIYPVNDLLFHSRNNKSASGTDKCIASLQNFTLKAEGCSLELNAVAKSREIGKPCFTEATTVSSLLPNNASVVRSTAYLDSQFTTLEAKQLVDMTFTAKSDSSMAELKIKRFHNMPPTAKLDFSTADLEARHKKLPAASFMVKERLSNNAPSNLTELQNIGTYSTYLGSSRSDSIDVFSINERSQKKLKSEETANLIVPYLASSVSSREFNTSVSQVTVVTKPRCQNLTLRSDVIQQPVSSPSQGVKLNNKSSQSVFKAPLFPMSSTAYLRNRSKEAEGSFHALRSRTWTRHDSLLKPATKVLSATSESQALSNKAGSQHIAYVRRGNSLLRASGPPMSMHATESGVSGCVGSGQVYSSKSSYRRNMSSTHGMAKVVPGIVKRVAANNDSSTLNIGGSVSPAVQTLPHDMKLQVSNTVSPQSSVERIMTVSSGRVEALHPRFPIIPVVDVSNADSLDEVKTSVGSHAMNIPTTSIPLVESNQSGDLVINSSAGAETYVKCKSDQLHSAPTSKCQASTASINEHFPLQLASPGQDHYYKKNTYQFLRSSMLADTKSTTSVQVSIRRSPAEAIKELKYLALKTQRSSRAYQTNLGRVLKQKKHATSQSSQVWTLNGAHPSLVTLPRVQIKKMVPLLLPWKRPASIVAHSGQISSVPNVSKGSSLISKKLRCLRKRHTCYSRSAIVRLGGSNLKWTKSVEKHYGKSNQEAKIATATLEKRKREEKDGVMADVDINVKEQVEKQTACKVSQGLRLHDRERNVYVGLSRYKMDPSKRTLQRIADEGSSCNNDTSYVRLTPDIAAVFTPRRSSIGGIEYVRVGNGDQLVRDPLTVSRALASEKVRRSLHTLRCGQVKKQKYCKILARFGKCNKEDGRCPYNHDSEKVAICKQFLKGTCSNLDCRLTHKVIPEQLPDCLNFLLGFCTLEGCPYRHVNVSPNALICDGFLKGSCVDSDKCNKKHTYVCAQYASTGYCSERSTCKLQHPKKKIKSKLPSNAHKKGGECQNRYFVSLGDSDHFQSPSTAVDLNGRVKHGMEVISREDESADFISLNTSEKDSEPNISGDDIDFLQRVCSLAFGDLQMPTNAYDMLIKPILLLQSQV